MATTVKSFLTVKEGNIKLTITIDSLYGSTTELFKSNYKTLSDNVQIIKWQSDSILATLDTHFDKFDF